MTEGLIKALPKLKGVKVLVIGDVILDEHVWCNVKRISPEAPVPVAEVTSVTYAPGGAANVANNIRALGGEAQLIGVVGNDSNAEKLRQVLKENGISADMLIAEPDRPTTLKSRIIAHAQQVVRVDHEQARPVNGATVKKILESVKKQLNGVDAVLVSDYAKGVLAPEICTGLISEARKQGKPVSIDPKGKDYTRYGGATILTPNLREAEDITGISINSNEDAAEAGRKLLHDLDLQYVLITRGEAGMSLVGKDGIVAHIPAMASEIYDVTGAGDTVLATLTLALAAGTGIEDAVRLANWAAGVVVRKVGTTVATIEEIEQAMRYDMRAGVNRKIMSLDELTGIVKSLKEKGKRIVTTNGCFDLLHLGHIRYLQEARELGDVLIVAVNSDASVSTIKGKNRPLLPEADRLQILAALECVDYVIAFPELTPEKLIGELRPDIHVKGGDYRPDELPEAGVVKSYGGEVVVVNEVEGKSTTEFIELIVKRFSQ